MKFGCGGGRPWEEETSEHTEAPGLSPGSTTADLVRDPRLHGEDLGLSALGSDREEVLREHTLTIG